MGHRLDAVVTGDSQQALIGNSGMVDLDVGEFGDRGCLEQTGIIQPGVVEGQKVQLTALQGRQAAAVDGSVAIQQQVAQLRHGGKDCEAGVGESTVFHAQIYHAFMPGKGGEQFIRYWAALHMEARQGVPGQPLHDLYGQLWDFKLFFSVQGQDTAFPVRCPRSFRPFHNSSPYSCSP